MLIAHATGPTLADLRPLKPERAAGTFPVHPDLSNLLADPATEQPDRQIAHSLAVASTYAYAQVAGFCEEPDTLARMMARTGLPGNRTLLVADRVDASFIVASGYVVQSDDGRSAMVVFRGTEPFNLANWLTDADIHSEQVTISVGGRMLTVHPGFYRNLRAIRSPLIAALDRARRGRSILSEDEAVEHPLQSLYIAGHSLGGAMASLLGLLVLNDPSYAELREVLRGVYTYGAPMVGDPELAEAVAAEGQGEMFLRFAYGRDVVPHLPPWGLGRYRHFGREFRPGGDCWVESGRPIGQAPFFSIPMAPVEFLSRSLPIVRHLWFPYSLSDHLPVNYLEWLAPEWMASEYGDYGSHTADSPTIDLTEPRPAVNDQA